MFAFEEIVAKADRRPAGRWAEMACGLRPGDGDGAFPACRPAYNLQNAKRQKKQKKQKTEDPRGQRPSASAQSAE
jgi:hypothetical protein